MACGGTGGKGQTYHKGTIWNDLIPDFDIPTTEISSEGGAQCIQPNAVSQAKIRARKFRFPRVQWNVLKLCPERSVPVRRVLFENEFNFLSDLGHPVRVLAEIGQNKCSVNTTVQLTGEESADDELMRDKD